MILLSTFHEFFEDDKGRKSMARLLCFMSFFPSSFVVVTTRTDNALLYYIGGYVLGYIGGKGCDAWATRRNAEETP